MLVYIWIAEFINLPGIVNTPKSPQEETFQYSLELPRISLTVGWYNEKRAPFSGKRRAGDELKSYYFIDLFANTPKSPQEGTFPVLLTTCWDYH